MLYSEVCDSRISQLAYGCMRFPTLGSDAAINEAETAKLLSYAYENGVNYFDTAYVYHNGESEKLLGKLLKKFSRNKFYLATKLPGWFKDSQTNPRKYFEEQLEKCGTHYFDFYLLHNVAEGHIDTYINEDYGVIKYLLEEKAKGRIRHLGFSTHGRIETVKDFLDKFGSSMEFAQIQLNWLDWKLQNAKGMYDLLGEYNIPVWVMEPVRGGTLANLSDENNARLKALRPDESIASWAFRWLQTLPNVKTTLSGMTTFEQVQDNIKTYSVEKPLSKEETDVLAEIADSMLDLLPCTSCRYCVKGCPMGIDIPVMLAYYNDCRFIPNMNSKQGVLNFPPQNQPKACIKCGSCVDICPQRIDIPTEFEKFVGIMDKMGSW
ncbi:MAG: aldo/keto reductase [Oscillospiraceae bacterium]|jgi:predicted aldo/keto reductase-like oxidoreductase|nr:aldo/keto reductase [Oscillospiraceae bacterium]